ncbi:MAG: T9SS type A sorting domain-containing protein [Bacteroidales bacterium]|nr:T9SS type A sorting domain-containing protein [Bacteroidales bacterium]
MKKLVFILLCMFSSMLIVNAQTGVTVGTVSSAVQGQIITVPVTITGCDATNGGTGVTGFEMHFSYTNAVQYYGITNLYSGFSAGDCNFNGTGSQFIGLWSSPTFLPYDIPNGTVLFEVQFIAKNGGVSPLDFMNTGSQTILLDQNFDVIASTLWTNGSITLPAPAATTRWNSAAAQSWTTQANWSNGLPGLTSNVIVETGTMTIDNAAFLCNNLTVNAGAAMTINSGVTVNVPSNFTLDAIASNTRTGSLINNGTLNVAGQRIVKRWLSGGVNHFISTPLRMGTTVNTLYTASNPGWAYSWSEATQTWTNMVQLNTPLIISYGYAVNYSQPKTLTFSITDNPGFNVGPSYNPTTSFTAANGWNLVGNPYLATLDWLGSGWTKTKIDNALYFYNGSTYSSFVGGVGTNGGTQYIPAMQGFFVHANGTGPNLVMSKTGLVHNAQTYYKESIPDVLRLSITGNGATDEAVVRFDQSSTAGFDSDFDAYKIFSMDESVPQISTTNTDQELSINCQPEITSNLTIPVSLKIGAFGSYSLNTENLGSFNQDVEVYLEDLSTGKTIDMRSTPSYSFEAAQGDLNRFNIRIQKSTGLGNNAVANNQIRYNAGNLVIENVTGTLEVYSMSGQLILSQEIDSPEQHLVSMSNAPKGVYLVKLFGNSSNQVVKVQVN